jgi:hypothetical protein
MPEPSSGVDKISQGDGFRLGIRRTVITNQTTPGPAARHRI